MFTKIQICNLYRDESYHFPVSTVLPENIALGKPAWRSHDDTRWLPSNAVDGNTNTMAYVYNDGLGDEDHRDFVAVDFGRSLSVRMALLKLRVKISEYYIGWLQEHACVNRSVINVYVQTAEVYKQKLQKRKHS